SDFKLNDLQPAGLTDRAESAIRATLSGPGVNTTNDSSVWLAGPEGMHLLAREGDAIADGGHTVLKQLVTGPTINSSGQVLFSAYLGGLGVDEHNDAAIF